jgi:hypothetical protein
VKSGLSGMVLNLVFLKAFVMIIPLIALVAVFIFLILFFVFAGKKKSQGEDLGDSIRNPANRPFNQNG